MSTIASTNIKHPSSATNNITLASTGAVAVNGAMTGAGLDLIIPTSVAVSGGSASVSGGQITFSGVSSISINGCFVSTYDNYRIIIDSTSPSANNYLDMRLRNNGTDDTSASYRYAIGYVGLTSATMTYQTQETGSTRWRASFMPSADTTNSVSIDMYSPKKADLTRFAGNGTVSSQTQFLGGMFVSATQFDGFTIYSEAASTIGGTLRVYAYKNS